METIITVRVFSFRDRTFSSMRGGARSFPVLTLPAMPPSSCWPGLFSNDAGTLVDIFGSTNGAAPSNEWTICDDSIHTAEHALRRNICRESGTLAWETEDALESCTCEFGVRIKHQLVY